MPFLFKINVVFYNKLIENLINLLKIYKLYDIVKSF